MTEERKNNKIWRWVIIGVVGIVLILFLIVLLSGKEDYVSGGEQVTRVSSLDCSATELEEVFFKSEAAQRFTHEIKLTYKNNKMDDISYIFEATFNSREAVEDASAVWHAEYNKYMGENKLNPESLNPQFMNLKSKLQVTLYGDKDKIKGPAARLFFLTEEEAQEISKYNLNQLEKLYKAKGFSCTKQE